MPNTLLFIAIFVCQIWLLSFYLPHRYTNRINYLLTHFPENEYPKLYPESEEKVKQVKVIYLIMNYVIMVIGIAILCQFSLFDDTYQQSDKYMDGLPLFYGLLQYIPVAYLEIAGRNQLKLMRLTDKRTNRSASLTPRSLFNFIPHWLIASVLFAFIASFTFDLYVNDWHFTEKVTIKLASLIATNALFAAIAYYHLYGKKCDPYQSDVDRQKVTQHTIYSLSAISIFVSMFFAAQTYVNHFDHSYAEIIINSLYFQILAIASFINIARGLDLKTMDFSGYRKDV